MLLDCYDYIIIYEYDGEIRRNREIEEGCFYYSIETTKEREPKNKKKRTP